VGYKSKGGKEIGWGELKTKYHFEMNSLL